MLCYIPENTCILHIVHVFHTYPKRVQDTFWDTHEIHYDTCILGASLVSHWIHVRIHQDTCILDSSSRYIRIHRDTKSRYMYLGRVMTNICGIHARIYAGYMRDTCICSGSRIHRGYMRDTSGIHHERHVSQMYAERYVSEVQDTCEIHAGYMYPHISSEVIKIHTGYIRDT